MKLLQTLQTKRFALLCLLFFGLNFSASASHYSGGELTFAYAGPNQYLVTFTVYRDCNGVTVGATQIVNYSSAACGVNASITLNIQSVTEVTPLCPTEPSACTGGGSLGIQLLVFEGLLTLPPGCSDWVLSTESCCRNAAITNLTSPGSQSIYIEAHLNNTPGLMDSSPSFSSPPQFFGCVGQTINFQQLAYDADGDSLVYSLMTGLQTAGGNVNYAGGFSGTNPFTVPLVLNPSTGQITFTPNVPQVAVVAVLIQEYRNGVLIGSIMRDIQFVIRNCNNNLPLVSGINNVPGDYEVTICQGATTCFDIFGTDPDAGQNLSLTYAGSIPGAIFTQTGTPAAPSGTFCWNSGTNPPGDYTFSITAEDDACPLIGQNSVLFTIHVVPNPNDPVNAGPDVSICAGETVTLSATTTATNGVSYNWTPVSGLSTPNLATTNATPVTTTSYTVNLLYADGCSNQDAVTVTILSAPTANTFPANADACGGAGFLLSGTTNQTGMFFEWFDSGMASLGSGTVSGSQSTLNITVPSAPGTYAYVLVVTDPISGCEDSDTSYITVGTPPVLPSCVNIYVSTTGSVTAAGTQADPTTLAEGLARAACNDAVIKIATGTYNINTPLTIGSFVTLEGGFQQGSGWTKISTPGATTINRTTANPEGVVNAQRLVAFYANGSAGFRLQDLTITTANANLPGMSTYALHLSACSDYKIVRTRLLPGNAGAGSPGISGANGNIGRNGGNGSAGDIDDDEDAGGGGGGGGGGGTTLGTPGANASGNFNSANNCTINGGVGGTGGLTAGNGGNGTGDTNGCGCCNGGTQAAAGTISSNTRSGGGGGGGGNGGCENGGGGNGGLGGGVTGLYGTNSVGGGAGSEGNDGANGGNGLNGTIGAAGVLGAAGSQMVGFWQPGTQGSNGANGTGGQGGRGGGGGGGQGCFFCVDGCGSGGGGGGGGGQGGAGGTGGFGGGSSFGLYLFMNGANGEVIQSTFTAGAPGAGGAGGAGGGGGAGGNGGIGSPYGGSEVGGGGNGGIGGNGGAGGVGGSGVPGISNSLYVNGTALSISQSSFNLAAQPIITVTNVNCVDTDVNFVTPIATTWNFTANATPQSPTGVSVITQFGLIDRYDIIAGANTYAGFHNIAFSGIDPEIVSNAPTLGVDTFIVCQGDFAAFESLYFADIYNWNFNGAIPNPGSMQVVSSQFNTPGFFQITMNMTTDCCGLSPDDMVYLYVVPVSSATGSGDIAICEGESTVLSLAGFAATDSIVWSPLTNSVPVTIGSISVNPATTTMYTASVYSSVTGGGQTIVGCPVSLSFVVTVNPLPTITMSSTSVICSDDGSATATVGNPGLYNFNWDNGYIENGVTSSTNSNLAVGNYVVTVTDPISGCSASDSVDVLPSATTPVVYVQTLTGTCEGVDEGTVTVATSGGTAPFVYTWSDIGVGPASRTLLPTGVYSVTVTDALGCSTSLTFDIPEFESAHATVTPNGPICSGDSAYFIIEGHDASTLTYNFGGADTTLFFTADTMYLTVYNVTSNLTMYLVSMDNGQCIEYLTDFETVVVLPLPSVTITTNSPVCTGDDAVFTLTGTPDATVTYSIGGSALTTTTLFGGTATITVFGAVSDITIVLDSINDGACPQFSGATETITILPIPTFTENVSVCQNDSYTYPDGTVETITMNTSHVSTLTAASTCDSIVTTNVTMNPIYAITVDLDVCENDTYTYPDGSSELIIGNTTHVSNLTTVNLCDSIITTNITMLPIYDLAEAADVCSGGSYTFPDGAIHDPILVDETYTSNLTTVAGCDSIIVTSITVLPLPTVAITTNSPVCYGGDAIFTLTGTVNADVTYTIGANPPVTVTLVGGTVDITVVGATSDQTIVIDLIDDGLCPQMTGATETITVNPLISVNLDVEVCENETYTYPDGSSEVIVANTTQVSDLTTAAGCDSTITTNVIMNPEYTIVSDVDVCENASYTYPDGTVAIITGDISQTSNLITAKGCDSVIVTNVTMLPIYSSTQDVAVCSGDAYTFPDGTVHDPILADETYSSVFTSANGCDSTIITNITVNPLPIVSAGLDDALCDGESTTLTAINPSGATIVWNNGIMDGVSFTPASTTTYTVSATSADGCLSTDEVVITVNPNPVAAFSADVLDGCDPLTVVFTNSSSLGSVLCEWEFGDGQTATGCTSVTHAYGNDGLYTVSLTVTDANGCSDNATYADYISVYAQPIAEFTFGDGFNVLDTEVQFDNQSIDASSYVWDFGDGSSTSSVTNPLHTFPDGGGAGFIVTLIANNGVCADTIQHTVVIDDVLIYYIPNTFTPDGNSVNQTFQPVFSSGYDPYDFQLLIFNRWGEIIFESRDAAIGWDGTYNGVLVQDGTYVWKVEFKELMSDKRHTDTGHVNLIR